MPSHFPALWRYVADRWFTAVLLLACLVFGANGMSDRLALREFESHVDGIASMGGGVLFVMSVADCLETADVAAQVANGLQAEGIAVRGLVIRDGVDQAGLQRVMREANTRFPHLEIDGRGVAAFAGRAGTPVVLGIGSSGDIWVSERFGLEGVAGAAALTRRLHRAVTVGR